MKAIVTACIFFFILHLNQAEAQDVNRTHTEKNGSIGITFVVNDSAVIARSDEVIIYMNYPKTDFIMKLNPATLKTGIDSLDIKIKNTFKTEWVFKGRLNVDFINASENNQQDITSEGRLEQLDDYAKSWIEGTGTLAPSFNGLFPQILTLHYKLNLKDLGCYPADWTWMDERIQVDIRQGLLITLNHR